MITLQRESELLAHRLRANGVEKSGVRVDGLLAGLWHGPSYQTPVDASSDFDLIALAASRGHISGVTFGERLTAAWKKAGFKSERQAAIACEVSPQRFNSWTMKDKKPDRLTLARVARILKTTPAALLSDGQDEGLKDILLHLFGLEGIPGDRADTLASAVLEAKRLLEVFPEDAPLATRASHAAHAAWQQRQPQRPDT